MGPCIQIWQGYGSGGNSDPVDHSNGQNSYEHPDMGASRLCLERAPPGSLNAHPADAGRCPADRSRLRGPPRRGMLWPVVWPMQVGDARSRATFAKSRQGMRFNSAGLPRCHCADPRGRRVPRRARVQVPSARMNGRHPASGSPPLIPLPFP
jgi:hypothetical protein